MDQVKFQFDDGTLPPLRGETQVVLPPRDRRGALALEVLSAIQQVNGGRRDNNKPSNAEETR